MKPPQVHVLLLPCKPSIVVLDAVVREHLAVDIQVFVAPVDGGARLCEVILSLHRRGIAALPEGAVRRRDESYSAIFEGEGAIQDVFRGDEERGHGGASGLQWGVDGSAEQVYEGDQYRSQETGRLSL